MRILYICTGNACRSPVAEALTRKYKPDLEVESAGTEPGENIAENMKKLLEETRALQFIKPFPERVSQRAVEEADKIVAMMPEHKEFLIEKFDAPEEKIDVWNVRDPVNPDVDKREVFEKIKSKIKDLSF